MSIAVLSALRLEYIFLNEPGWILEGLLLLARRLWCLLVCIFCIDCSILEILVYSESECTNFDGFLAVVALSLLDL